MRCTHVAFRTDQELGKYARAGSAESKSPELSWEVPPRGILRGLVGTPGGSPGVNAAPTRAAGRVSATTDAAIRLRPPPPPIDLESYNRSAAPTTRGRRPVG